MACNISYVCSKCSDMENWDKFNASCCTTRNNTYSQKMQDMLIYVFVWLLHMTGNKAPLMKELGSRCTDI